MACTLILFFFVSRWTRWPLPVTAHSEPSSSKSSWRGSRTPAGRDHRLKVPSLTFSWPILSSEGSENQTRDAFLGSTTTPEMQGELSFAVGQKPAEPPTFHRLTVVVPFFVTGSYV